MMILKLSLNVESMANLYDFGTLFFSSVKNNMNHFHHQENTFIIFFLRKVDNLSIFFNLRKYFPKILKLNHFSFCMLLRICSFQKRII